MTTGDLDSMFALLGDPEVMRFYPAPKSREEAADWIRWNLQNYAEHGYGLWIVETSEGAFVGDCGLTWQEVNGVQKLEVGYHVLHDLQGQGFATEAAAACRDFARDQVRATELVAIIHPDNLASERVAEKIGMHRVADDRGGSTPVRTVLSMLLVDVTQLGNMGLMTSPIRLVVPSDDEALAQLQVENRDFLAPWDPVRSDDYFTAAGQRNDINAALARCQRGEAVPWVVLNDNAVVAGRLTLNGIVRGAFQSCSMGYWIAEDETGKGLATSAVRAALTFAFDQLRLHRVQAETLTNNVASQRVLVKAGFTQYGLAPRYLKIAGQWQDHVMFQLLNESRR